MIGFAFAAALAAPCQAPGPPPRWTLGSERFVGASSGFQWTHDDRRLLNGTQLLDVATGLPAADSRLPKLAAGRWVMGADGEFALDSAAEKTRGGAVHAVWNFRTDARQAAIPALAKPKAQGLALSRGARYAAFGWGEEGDGGFAVVEVATGKTAFAAKTASGKAPAVMMFARHADRLALTFPGERRHGIAVEAYGVPDGRRLYEHTQEAWGQEPAIDFSPDGTRVALAGADQGQAAVLVGTVPGSAVQRLDTGASRIVDVSFSPDGLRLAGLAVGPQPGLAFWRLPSGAAEERREPERGFEVGLGLNFSRDGRRIATMTGGGIRLWDARSGAETTPDRGGHVEPIVQFAVEPGGRRAATYGQDGALRLWSLPDGVPRREVRGLPGPCTGLAFSRDGARLVVRVGMPRLDDNRNVVRDTCLALVDAESGRAEAEVHLHDPDGEEYADFAFAPNGKEFAAAVDVGPVSAVVHDLRTGAALRKLGRPKPADPDVRRGRLHAGGGQQLAYAADAQELRLLDDRHARAVLRRWRLPQYEELPAIPLPWLLASSAGGRLAPDGASLAAPVDPDSAWMLPKPAALGGAEWPSEAYGLWRLGVAAPPRPLAGDRDLRFSPDGRCVGNEQVVFEVATGRVRAWKDAGEQGRRDTFAGLAAAPGGGLVELLKFGTRLAARDLAAGLAPGPWIDPAPRAPERKAQP